MTFKFLTLTAILFVGTLSFGQGFAEPCTYGTKQYAPISITASTKIATGQPGRRIYVCAIHVIVAAATNVALVEGTGSTCATNTAGMAGGATAATGWNFAANGGIVVGTGMSAVLGTAGSNTDVCLFLSASNQTSGTLAYVILP